MGKARKHTPEQIVNIRRQIEVAISNGKTAPVASREAGITEQTYYRWRKEYGALKSTPEVGDGESSDVVAQAHIDHQTVEVLERRAKLREELRMDLRLVVVRVEAAQLNVRTSVTEERGLPSRQDSRMIREAG
jgi:transposase-like protein